MTVTDFSNAFKNVLSQIKNAKKKNYFTAFSNTSIFSSPYIF